MSTTAPKSPPESVYVEAAAWVVRLHGPNRSVEVEAGLRRWLSEHADHRSAFELATETWNSSNLEQIQPSRLRRWLQARPQAGISLAAAAGAAAVVMIVIVVAWLHAPQVQTQIGEQRSLRLEDGTRVSLNTNTQLAVHYDSRQRLIALEQGEAFFDVASQPSRPFIVTAGSRRIEALGTAFVVRRESAQVAVTLMTGKVAVSAVNSHAPKNSNTGSEDMLLKPGERVIFAEARPLQRDQPNLETLVAWQRGLVMLDETPLAEAIVDMNRYNAVKLEIEQPHAAALEVSGIFHAGDSMRFARAVAKTYGLTIIERPDRIVLTGPGEMKPGVK